MAELVKCQWCGRLVKWVVMVSGKHMPLDPQPKPFDPHCEVQPNVFILLSGHARVLRAEELASDDPYFQPRWVTHWATCPQASKVKEFNKRRREQAELRHGLKRMGMR